MVKWFSVGATQRLDRGPANCWLGGGKTWLMCGPKEAKLSNIHFWRPRSGPQAWYLIVWACFGPQINQVFPQEVNMHHPTESSRSELKTYFPCGSYTPSISWPGRAASFKTSYNAKIRIALGFFLEINHHAKPSNKGKHNE